MQNEHSWNLSRAYTPFWTPKKMILHSAEELPRAHGLTDSGQTVLKREGKCAKHELCLIRLKKVSSEEHRIKNILNWKDNWARTGIPVMTKEGELSPVERTDDQENRRIWKNVLKYILLNKWACVFPTTETAKQCKELLLLLLASLQTLNRLPPTHTYKNADSQSIVIYSKIEYLW